MKDRIRAFMRPAAAFFSVCFLLGCGANEGVLKAGKETPIPFNAAPARSSVEKEVDAMRTARFASIFVVKRKDGKNLEVDDRGIIKRQTADADRRVATEDGLAVVIGTNMQIPAGNMKALSDRFVVDDYSQAAASSPAGTSTTNK